MSESSPIERSIRVDWAATLTGLQISFEAGGTRHYSVLGWEALEAERRSFEQRLFDQLPKIEASAGPVNPQVRDE